MPVIEKHAPGSFCWMELSTSDQNAAKQFYTSLFGWEATDYPMGPSGTYTIFRSQGRDCSAACTQMEAGVPPHWMLYIATANVDESTRRAVELGATAHGPFDVPSAGRMSVIRDPEGAHFSLWQANQTPGIAIAGEPNTYCWADLMTRDRDAAAKFYSALFNWSFTPGEGPSGESKDPSGYWHIVNGGEMIGGVPPTGHMRPGVPPHWGIYYLVTDCEAATAKAVGLGASVYVPPMKIEGAGEMSVLADPQGAVFCLFKPTM